MLLEAVSISKAFAGVQALRGVSFDLSAGEVHALVGENGAGKSTFIKIVCGAEMADSGTLAVAGRPIDHMAISAPAVPGAAEAVRQSGRSQVKVIGLSLPNMNKPYVHGGVVQTVVLWNTRDLGYLTVYASVLDANGKLAPGTPSFEAGRLGRVNLRDSEIILGPPLLFNKDNIDRFDF